MKLFSATIATAAFLASAGVMSTAAAQEPATAAATAIAIEVGSEVFDRDGASIGTIKSNEGGVATISIGDKQIAIPTGSFGRNEKGLVLGASVAELQAALAQQEAAAAAQLDAAIVAGASVKSLNGTATVGTIKGIENDMVLLTTEKGQFGFPKTAFYLPAHGLSIAYTAEQFDKTITEAAAGAASAAPQPAGS